MNNKNIEEQIKEIFKNNKRYARYENCGHEIVDEDKAVKELTNLLQAEKEQYLDEFAEWFDEGEGKRYNQRYLSASIIEQFKKESV